VTRHHRVAQQVVGDALQFPGGQTESAAIQLRVSNASEDDASGFMTVLVSPLTGKTSIKKGRVELPANRSEEEASEREDPGT
jgi:general secretion pathway protein H